MNLELLKARLEEKEKELKSISLQVNFRLGQIEGEVSMLKELIEIIETPPAEKTLPSEDATER